jgi:hypothetical protein
MWIALEGLLGLLPATVSRLNSLESKGLFSGVSYLGSFD